MNIEYHGFRDARRGRTCVMIKKNGMAKPLPMRLDLDPHSPTGFEWGYAGSGPAQLALALLAHALGDDERALRLHQRFKFQIIRRLHPEKEWRLTRQAVRAIADQIEREHPKREAAE